MQEVNLENYHVSQLSFVNKLDRPTQLELNTQYSYNVGYGKDNTCCGEFSATVCDKRLSDKFCLNITVVGIFRTRPDVEKEILHVKTYDALFPYVKAIVSSVTANFGVPSMNIPYIDISGQEIYRMDMPVQDD